MGRGVSGDRMPGRGVRRRLGKENFRHLACRGEEHAEGRAETSEIARRS